MNFMSIAAFFYRCGYSMQDTLNRALRAAEGSTPREFRKRSENQRLEAERPAPGDSI